MESLVKWDPLKKPGQMLPANTQTSLLVLGVHLKSEGYPNTLFRLRDLEATDLLRILEINVPMWKEVSHNRHGCSRLIKKLLQAVFAHSAVIVRYLAVKKRPELVYVPYPGVFVLFLLSCLPSRLRPQFLVADVFITLYDTIVHDRHLLKQGGLPARVLKWIERRAYNCADKLVVDTEQNARFLRALFRLPEAKAVVTSLSTDEIHFRHTPYFPHPGICRVLFVGTLVPLHGIGTLLEAIHLLSGRSDIHFKLIGDGQDSRLVEAWLQTHSSQLEWEREWQPSVRVAEAISQADICLGIFGAGNKTQRVCPFKIYAYAAIGRAIITGETNWLKESTDQLFYEPFAKVPVNNATALAAKINQLADDQAFRISLAENSRKFYKKHLGNQPALEKLVACLLEG